MNFTNESLYDYYFLIYTCNKYESLALSAKDRNGSE